MSSAAVVVDARHDDQASALDAAADFIQQVLGTDVVPSKSVYAEAKEAGIAKRTLERTSEKLAVKKRRGDGGKWYWSLPRSSNSANTANVESMENMADLGT